MDELGKRILIGTIVMFGGYGFIKVMIQLNDVKLMGISAQLFNSIDGAILFGIKALAVGAAGFIVFIAVMSLLESRGKAKQKIKDEQQRKINDELEAKRLKRLHKEEKEKQKEKDEKDRLWKLEQEQRKQSEIEYQKKRSAEEATKDSLSDFL
jgi:predicted nucleotide-binding protein (sugar kinase/HSP70/actin superfamily)